MENLVKPLQDLIDKFRSLDGVGKKKSADLLKKFGSVENIRRATDEDIALIEGFSLKSAKALKESLEKVLSSRDEK